MFLKPFPISLFIDRDLSWDLLIPHWLDIDLTGQSWRFICLFDLGLTSLSTIFQSYRNGAGISSATVNLMSNSCLI